MKVIVHPSLAGYHPVLDVYELQPGQAAYAGPPDANIACGDVWLGSSYHSTFVVGASGKIYCVINGMEIIAFTPPLAEGSEAELMYTHNTWIRQLALRTVQGVERLYFSAASPTTQDQNRVSIFWLDQNNGAHSYWQVGKNDLLVPNPCQPGEDCALFYAGDFTFGEQDRLYLSNGNSSPCGIFRVDGASPDSVAGQPERIFVTDSYSMSDFQYDGQGGLLFTDYSTDSTCLPYRLRRYDLATGNTEILWNMQGTEFRSFALYPDSGQVIHNLGIDYLKRLKYKIKIPYLRPHLVKERV